MVWKDSLVVNNCFVSYVWLYGRQGQFLGWISWGGSFARELSWVLISKWLSAGLAIRLVVDKSMSLLMCLCMNSATQINNCPFACRKWERLQCSSILFLYPSPLQAKVFEWFKVSWEIEKVKNYPSQTKIAMTRFLSTSYWEPDEPNEPSWCAWFYSQVGRNHKLTRIFSRSRAPGIEFC